ncbi:hypothetical protein HIM_00953 [Hirsutella minnesotensis 3608]|nr:hypothetical protein HIM_00953 [Hirsutella minnesotensis 3608]
MLPPALAEGLPQQETNSYWPLGVSVPGSPLSWPDEVHDIRNLLGHGEGPRASSPQSPWRHPVRAEASPAPAPTTRRLTNADLRAEPSTRGSSPYAWGAESSPTWSVGSCFAAPSADLEPYGAMPGRARSEAFTDPRSAASLDDDPAPLQVSDATIDANYAALVAGDGLCEDALGCLLDPCLGPAAGEDEGSQRAGNAPVAL